MVVTLFSDGGDVDCDCSDDRGAAISAGLHQLIKMDMVMIGVHRDQCKIAPTRHGNFFNKKLVETFPQIVTSEGPDYQIYKTHMYLFLVCLQAILTPSKMRYFFEGHVEEIFSSTQIRYFHLGL